ncbi:MAG TPA: DMT family transporter [Candidatus Limnocylindria bacterium]|nr:DMT family transporter [Candidatus Limnocylindria bacterium]
MPPLRVVLAYVTVALIWGSTWAAIKVGINDVPPFMFAFERAVAVAVLLSVAGLALRQSFPRDARMLALAAVVGVINIGWSWAIIFWAEQYVPSGLVSVFGASAPVWTAVLAHFMVKGDRLSALKLIGLLLGLAGTVLLIGAPEAGDGATALLATSLLALMPITWAIAAVLQAGFLTHTPPITTVAVGTWVSVLLLAPLALLQAGEPQRWTAASVLAFGYLVVFGTCLGMVLSLWLYRKLRPTTITLIQVIVPAEAILIGTAWLGEPLTVRMLGGAVLVAAAVALNALAGGGPPAAERAAAPGLAAAK